METVPTSNFQFFSASMRGGRPSAREASRNFLASAQLATNAAFNSLVMQWGQFIAHDISKTALLPNSLCAGCADTVGKCSPIRVDGDAKFGCATPPCCLPFTRAAPVCGTGTSSVRLQLNENTAFIDASMVYGSSVPDNNQLRNGALMNTGTFNGRGNFLPFDSSKCTSAASCDVDFGAGDKRLVIFVGLTALHTLMLREHNRIATALQRLNAQWSAERVFQEARKIVGAELQVSGCHTVRMVWD